MALCETAYAIESEATPGMHKEEIGGELFRHMDRLFATQDLASTTSAVNEAQEAKALCRRTVQEDIDVLVRKQDYDGAVALKAVMETSSGIPPSPGLGLAAKAVQEVEALRTAKAVGDVNSLRRRKFQEDINELLTKQDYTGAVALKATMEKPMDGRSSSRVQSGCSQSSTRSRGLVCDEGRRRGGSFT